MARLVGLHQQTVINGVNAAAAQATEAAENCRTMNEAAVLYRLGWVFP